jgi:hypothetical protein
VAISIPRTKAVLTDADSASRRFCRERGRFAEENDEQSRKCTPWSATVARETPCKTLPAYLVKKERASKMNCKERSEPLIFHMQLSIYTKLKAASRTIRIVAG